MGEGRLTSKPDLFSSLALSVIHDNFGFGKKACKTFSNIIVADKLPLKYVTEQRKGPNFVETMVRADRQIHQLQVELISCLQESTFRVNLLCFNSLSDFTSVVTHIHNLFMPFQALKIGIMILHLLMLCGVLKTRYLVTNSIQLLYEPLIIQELSDRMRQ